MYANLKAELARKGMSLLSLSERTGIRYQTLSEKIRGNSNFTVNEAIRIKNELNVTIAIEELFATDDETEGDE